MIIPWVKIIGGLIIFAALSFLVHRALEHFREEGRAEIQAKWDKDKAAQEKRSNEIITQLSDKLMEFRDEAAKASVQAAKDFAPVDTAAASVRRSGGIRIPDDVVRVFDSAASAANGKAGAIAEARATGAAPVAAVPETHNYDEVEIAQWAVATDKAYEKTVEYLRACYHRELSYWAALNEGRNP